MTPDFIGIVVELVKEYGPWSLGYVAWYLEKRQNAKVAPELKQIAQLLVVLIERTAPDQVRKALGQ